MEYCRVFNIESWLTMNEQAINNIFDYIVNRIKKEVYVKSPVSYYYLNEDKLYHYLVRYLYNVSNNKNKNLVRMR